MYPYSIPPEVIIAQQNDNDVKSSKRGISGLIDNYITQNPKEVFLNFRYRQAPPLFQVLKLL